MLHCGIAALQASPLAWPTSTAPSTVRSAFRARSPTSCSSASAPPTSATPPASVTPTRAVRDRAAVPTTPFEFWRQWSEYSVDAMQRSVLYWDTLRQRGNQWLAHEAAGKPPVLMYKYETIADARSYERPVNYALVRIIPPKGVTVDDAKRPFVIVDPRAGHGPGHRRLQGRLGGRRGAVRRPSGVLRDLLSRADAGADAGGRHRRRSRVHPHRRRAPSEAARSPWSSATARAAGR